MKNIVAMLLAMTVVSGTAVLAAETGKETTTTTDTTVKKPGVKHKHRRTVVHHKTDVKTGKNKTTTENSTKTESTQKQSLVVEKFPAAFMLRGFLYAFVLNVCGKYTFATQLMRTPRFER